MGPQESLESLVSEQSAGLTKVLGEMPSTRCADFRAIEAQAENHFNKKNSIGLGLNELTSSAETRPSVESRGDERPWELREVERR